MAKTVSQMQAYRAKKSSQGGALSEAIHEFTDGGYLAIRTAAEHLQGKSVDMGFVDENDISHAKALMGAVEKGGKPIDITRTIVSDRVPSIGDSVSFTLSSGSTRKDWAAAIAKEQVVGMGANWNSDNPWRTIQTPVVAYHIGGQTKYVDVSKSSAYKDQKEAIFSGNYKVAGVTKETVDTGISSGRTTEVRLSPQEYAKKHNMPISTFTSKKGKTMYQIGEAGKSGSKTYPEGSKISDGFVKETIKRDIYHVQLRNS